MFRFTLYVVYSLLTLTLTLLLTLTLTYQVAFADSKSDALIADLRARLVATEAARQVAVHDKSVLEAARQLAVKQNVELASRLEEIARTAEQADQHSKAEKAAVAQSQIEQAQTLFGTNQIVQSQTEAEHQLTRVEGRLNETLTRVNNLTRLLLIMLAVQCCFTGAVVFAARRKPSTVVEAILHVKEPIPVKAIQRFNDEVPRAERG